MSYRTVWYDDDVVAESDDGLTRVVLRPDENSELDGDAYPILVRHDHRGGTESCTGEPWYHPNVGNNGDDDNFARAVDWFIYNVGGRSGFDMLERWVRLYLGGTKVVQFETQDSTFFACDSAYLWELWGMPADRVLTDEDVTMDIPDFLNGEVYSYTVQTRESDDSDDWEDTDEMLFGIVGRDYAESEAREALAYAT